ncbi:MAG: type II toxin-antitoxin system HipA family toxin [Caulobacteraceae bacterium]|nr:type II toxin-antitoxin system HipA family toxin [Caulobacteraceae bacterium]
MSRALTVWWDEAEVGDLALNDHGSMIFRYAKSWLDNPSAPAISIFLPKQADAFSRARTRPFFAGLLPEEKPRTEAARALGVSQQNDFGLLEGLGGDVAGALTLWPRGETVPRPDPDGNAVVQDEPTLAAILEKLPRRPLLAGQDGIRLSLAGAQSKLPVVLVDGTVALPAPGQPTTHIIKPAPQDWPTFPENEAFCMRLAAALGLDVAPVEIRQAGGHLYLLVERYDRVLRDGVLARLHQEDFCQALGVMPEYKYAAEQGPNFPDSFNLLRRVTRVPARAILALIDAALFNLIIGNADAHGKNFSLLYTPEGLRLAPLYDLLCTSIYPDVHARMAMRMGGAARLEEITLQALNEFAAEAGVAAPYVRRRSLDLARRAGPMAVQVVGRLTAEGHESQAIAEVAAHVRRRAEALVPVVEAHGAPVVATKNP